MSSEGEGLQVPQQSATIGVVKPFIVEPASRSNNDVAQESGCSGTKNPVIPTIIDREVLLRAQEAITMLLNAVPPTVSEVDQAQGQVNSKTKEDDNVEATPSSETSSEVERREEMRKTKEELEAMFAKQKNAPAATSSEPPESVPETASAIPVPPPPPPPPPQLAESSSTPTLSKKATTAPADGKETDEKPSILLLNELKGALGGGKTLKKTERIEKKLEKKEEEKFSIKFQLRPVRKSEPNDSPSKNETISGENELVMKTFRRKSTTNESKQCEELPPQKPASELEEARQHMKKVNKNESDIKSVQEITENVKISSIPEPKPATTTVTSTESEGKGQLNFKFDRVLKRTSVSRKSTSPPGNAGEQVNSMQEHMHKFFQKKAAKAKDNTDKEKVNHEEKAEVRTEEKVSHVKADEVHAEFNVCPEKRGTEVPKEQVVKVNVNSDQSLSGESSMGKTEIRSENMSMDEQGKRNTVGQKNSTKPKPNKKPKSKSSPLNTQNIVTTTDGTPESVPVPLLPPPLPNKPKLEDIPPRGKSVVLHAPTITVPPSCLSPDANMENLEKTAEPSVSAAPPSQPKMEDIPRREKTVPDVLTETTVPPPPPPPPLPLHQEVKITKSSFSSATSFKQVMSSNGTKTRYSYEESSVKEKFVQEGVPDSHSALFEQINRIRETGTSFLRPVTTKAADNVRERVHTPTSKANDLMDSIKIEIGKRFSSWHSNDSEDSEECSDEEWDEDEVEE